MILHDSYFIYMHAWKCRSHDRPSILAEKSIFVFSLWFIQVFTCKGMVKCYQHRDEISSQKRFLNLSGICYEILNKTSTILEPASVAQLDHGFNPRRGRQHSVVEIDHEIFSTVILSLLLIQEGQLSVSGERMCTILVNFLEDLACPVNVWLGKLTALVMTPLGWLGSKTSTQTNKSTMLCCIKTWNTLDLKCLKLTAAGYTTNLNL